MTQLIQSLAKAHKALALACADAPDAAHLASTARKVEATILTEMKSQEPDTLRSMVVPIMNSGSLRALKLIPKDVELSRHSDFRSQPDTHFIIAQPPAYQNEAKKRGFVVAEVVRLDALKRLAQPTTSHEHIELVSIAQPGPVSTVMLVDILGIVFDLDAETSAKLAPTVAPMLKACVKTNADQLRSSLDDIFCLHDPAAAHHHLFRTIAIFALLGVKAPSKDAIENDEMAGFAKALFSRDGRKALNDETGGLEAFLAGGHLAPPNQIRAMEARRSHFRAPGSNRRGW